MRLICTSNIASGFTATPQVSPSQFDSATLFARFAAPKASRKAPSSSPDRDADRAPTPTAPRPSAQLTHPPAFRARRARGNPQVAGRSLHRPRPRRPGTPLSATPTNKQIRPTARATRRLGRRLRARSRSRRGSRNRIDERNKRCTRSLHRDARSRTKIQIARSPKRERQERAQLVLRDASP